MKNQNFSKAELKKLYNKLIEVSSQCSDNEFGMLDKDSLIWKSFSLSTMVGSELYKDLTDEQLLNVLQNKAKELGYSPSQHQLFWVWREYIKQRFQKWPYALKKAGLPTSAGKGGKSLQQVNEENLHRKALLNKVCEKAVALGRIPHPGEVPELCSQLEKYMDTWAEVIEAAGLKNDFFSKKTTYKIEDLEEEYISLLKEIEEQAVTLGRALMHSEVSNEIKHKLIQRCGSWRNALYQIHLEPVIRMKPFSSTYLDGDKRTCYKTHRNELYDCYYKLINPNKGTLEDLSYIKNIYDQLGRVPTRKEVPLELRKRLQDSCGSWSNALFQIKLNDKK